MELTQAIAEIRAELPDVTDDELTAMLAVDNIQPVPEARPAIVIQIVPVHWKG